MFYARLNNAQTGPTGLFTGASPTLDRIVVTGDSLFGSTVTNVYPSYSMINNQGQVVGWASLPNGDRHACLWKPDGTPVDLGTLGSNYSTAAGIDDQGNIAGTSRLPSDVTHGVLWHGD